MVGLGTGLSRSLDVLLALNQPENGRPSPVTAPASDGFSPRRQRVLRSADKRSVDLREALRTTDRGEGIAAARKKDRRIPGRAGARGRAPDRLAGCRSSPTFSLSGVRLCAHVVASR